MEMPAFNRIILLQMILLVPDVITATAIIEAAVTAITRVVVVVIIVCTVLREAVLMTDTTEAAPGRYPIHMTCHSPGHLDDTTAGHDLAKDVDPTHTAGADLNHQGEDTAITPI